MSSTTDHVAWSETLGEKISYRVHLTPGDDRPRSSLYLLHGRAGSFDDWVRVLPTLDEMTRRGAVPPLVVVLPDAPWSDRAGFYVDSAYAGRPPGRPVETALTHDLVQHVDDTWPTVPDRTRRFVGGNSMGGAGAVRWLLARPDLFAGGLALSPAVYADPPDGSSTRGSGAFGRGADRFVPEVYAGLAYPAQLTTFDQRSPVRLYVGAGDREDLALSAAELHHAVKQVRAIDTRLRIHGGDHDFDLWEHMLVEGLPFVLGVDS